MSEASSANNGNVFKIPLRLSEPAWLTLESPDGQQSVKIDIYAARRVLDDAYRKPDERERHEYILDYLAKTLSLDRDKLAENMALQFNNAIVKCVNHLNADLQKKTSCIVPLLTSTPESQATTEAGQQKN